MNYHGGNIYEYSNKLLDFSSNINPLGVPESFKNELIKRLEDFEKYPDINYTEVRESIANYLDMDCADRIIPGNGAVELIYKLTATSGCRRMVCLSPTFSEYRRAAQINGLEYTEIPAFGDNYESVDIRTLINNIKLDTIFVICNPNNPTGTLIKKKDMIMLAEEIEGHNCKLLIDEAFMEFTDEYPDDSMVDVLESFSNLMIIKAATKFFGMPGIRLGFAVMPENKAAKTAREIIEPWNLNTAAVIAACSVLKDEEYIEMSRKWIKTERKYMYERLNTINGLSVYRSSANFHLVKLTENDIDSSELYDILIKKNILIRLPRGFENLTKYHFRLAVKDRNSNEILINELSDIMKQEKCNKK